MWHDNESEVDLINVAHLAWAVSSTVQNAALLPLTVGVFGDWGSGKSSLLKLVNSELEPKEGFLCLWFNGWLFEGYEDAKVALLGSILQEIQAKRNLPAKAKGALKKLLRRVNIINAIGLAGKAGLAVAAAGLGDPVAALGSAAATVIPAVPEVIANGHESDAEEPDRGSIHGIREFRKDFESLLAESGITHLVVFIDDLDRCLPDTVIETLEALRLFLYTPRSAFIIAAHDEMIESAVRGRFPEAIYGNRRIGRDYLEKLVQVTISVPELSPQETINYINLLFLQQHLGSRIEEVVEKLVSQRKVQGGEMVMCDRAWLKEYCHDITLPESLVDDFALSQQIGDILATHLRGNPRQIKRFLNTLLLRLNMSAQRGVQLDRRILAKLMVLEYVDSPRFRVLAGLQAAQEGRPVELKQLEELSGQGGGGVPVPRDAVTGTDHAAVTALSEDLQQWTQDPWVRSWLASEPGVCVDLRPYFYVSRDAKSFPSISKAVGARVKEACDLLVSGSDVKLRQGLTVFTELDSREATSAVEEVARFAMRGDGRSGSTAIPQVLVKMAECRKDTAGQALQALRGIVEDRILAGLPPTLVILSKRVPEHTALIRTLLTEWSKQTKNPALAAAAKKKLPELG